MKYSVQSVEEGVRVSVVAPQEQQAKLLEEFGKCAAGTCSCPSTQYAKLEGVDVKQTADGVQVDLKARSGEVIDTDDIRLCLDFTGESLNG